MYNRRFLVLTKDIQPTVDWMSTSLENLPNRYSGL